MDANISEKSHFKVSGQLSGKLKHLITLSIVNKKLLLCMLTTLRPHNTLADFLILQKSALRKISLKGTPSMEERQ